MIPEPLRRDVESCLGRLRSHPVSIRESRPAGGGCINRASLLVLEDGTTAFLKWNPSAPPDLFQREAEGLEALARPNAIRVPKVLGYGRRTRGFLLLENLGEAPRESAPRGERRFAEELGRGLAALHSAACSRFGFDSDNYIGPTPQANGWMDSWEGFFVERRIRPMLRLLGRENVGLSSAQEDRFCDRIGALLSRAAEPPSLLHGDLWGGNVMRCANGEPALIDPATYCGNREADLAMTELFGGFPARFRSAYEEVKPLAAGYEERRDIHNLYHVLNHAILFGGGYAGQAAAVIRRHA